MVSAHFLSHWKTNSTIKISTSNSLESYPYIKYINANVDVDTLESAKLVVSLPNAWKIVYFVGAFRIIQIHTIHIYIYTHIIRTFTERTNSECFLHIQLGWSPRSLSVPLMRQHFSLSIRRMKIHIFVYTSHVFTFMLAPKSATRSNHK